MSLPTAQDAQDRLQTLLRESGVNVQSPSLADFWPVFKRFAAEDFGFDCDDSADGFLVEYFVPPSGTSFAKFPLLDFVRQFTYEDNKGLYDHMEQMRCVFNYEKPLGDPDVTSITLWSFQMPLDTYFTQVEALPVFQEALASAPISVEWFAEPV